MLDNQLAQQNYSLKSDINELLIAKNGLGNLSFSIESAQNVVKKATDALQTSTAKPELALFLKGYIQVLEGLNNKKSALEKKIQDVSNRIVDFKQVIDENHKPDLHLKRADSC